MSLLKSAPPAAVRSLEELFAIAETMEHEAALRYAELAERARADGVPELADLFERLASDERGHEQSVRRWAQRRSGKAPDPTKIRWRLPETFDMETAGELAASRLASAYRILSMAVRNEERAFAFWSYVVAEADNPEVRHAAERMAHEELGHVALLRRARRQAYHAERDTRHREAARSVSTLLAEAALLERRLAAELAAVASRLEPERAQRARELAAEARTMADEVARLAPRVAESAVAELNAPAAAERLAEDYLDIGDRSRDEAIVTAVQSLARRAILRLTWLRGLRGDDAKTG
ncbi:MAG: ferritin family protein [Alphaproteobacteria bacterium]|nr:ferritin family protein [Alphaproteobacteria bacterium]